MTDFETSPVGTLAELAKAKAERNALMAQWGALLESAPECNDCGWHEKVRRDYIEAAVDRLKAKWQAEALYEFTHGSYVMPATLNLAMCKRADELRHQAKEDR